MAKQGEAAALGTPDAEGNTEWYEDCVGKAMANQFAFTGGYMLTRKIQCIQCAKYTECSLQTRLFVNYCGPKTKSVELPIREAEADCSARHGQVLYPPVHDHSYVSYAARKSRSPAFA